MPSMNLTEMAIAAAALSVLLSLILFLNNRKLRNALQKQQSQSEMWRKSSESAFMMAQRNKSQDAKAKESAYGLS
jgi:hypothetical protein